MNIYSTQYTDTWYNIIFQARFPANIFLSDIFLFNKILKWSKLDSSAHNVHDNFAIAMN